MAPSLPAHAHPQRAATRLEEVPRPADGWTDVQAMLRRVYRTADDLPDDLSALIDRLR